MNIKLMIKVLKNNMVIKVLKIINKPCLIVSSNKKQILKIVNRNSSLINFTRDQKNKELFTEYDNIELITGKSPVIMHNY